MRTAARAAAVWLRRTIELLAAVAVGLEVLLLLVNVGARYLFDQPVFWINDLAGTLFIWLAMLGSAVAVSRGEHMRLAHSVARLPPVLRAQAEILALFTPALLAALLVVPGLDYVGTQEMAEMPALGWSEAVHAAALPVGFVVILLTCAMQLGQRRAYELAPVALLLASVLLGAYFGAPLLQPLGNWNLILFFVLLLGGCVFAGVPIAFAFLLATLAYLIGQNGVPLSIVVSQIDEGMSSFILLAVPLFVLLGQLMEMTGMARVMVEFLASLVGHLRGGLSYVLIGAMLLISGISGSKTADMAAVAPVLFPEMKRRGIDEGEMVALLSATGAMSETIPPSIVLIAIGSVTGISIAALFTAGLVPGILLGLVLAIVARYRAGGDSERMARAPFRQVGRSLVIALPALVMPFFIRSAVTGGIATATEVSTLGIAYAVIIGIFVYRQFDTRRILGMLVQTASLSGAVLLIVGAASAMSWALTQSGFSQSLAVAVASVPGGKFGFLLISICVFTVLGSVLEGIPAMVLFGPLLFPLAQGVGVNEVHYAVVAVLAMGLGLFAPPVGLGYYAACIVGRVDPDAGMRRIWPYLAALLIGLLIIAAVPWFSTGFLG